MNETEKVLNLIISYGEELLEVEQKQCNTPANMRFPEGKCTGIKVMLDFIKKQKEVQG